MYAIQIYVKFKYVCNTNICEKQIHMKFKYIEIQIFLIYIYIEPAPRHSLTCVSQR